MTDKEKLDAIRAEIHRLVDARGYDREMENDLFAFMDSLPNEPISDKFAFKAIPRLLEMIEPTDRAKAYIAKLADTLDVEGYSTDAKIVRESLKIMDGEKVAMATMDEEPVSEDLEKAIDTYLATYFGGEKEKQDWPFLKKMAIHFANLQKSRMTKNAVDKTVGIEEWGHLVIKVDDMCVKYGDKVKVIIIKKE